MQCVAWRSSGRCVERLGELDFRTTAYSRCNNRGKPWSIPQGLPDPGEALEAAARRETLEETAVVAGNLIPLGSLRDVNSGKQIHCFSGPAPAAAQPVCASWEVDRSEFVTLAEARRCLHPDQVPFLDRLEQHLNDPGASSR